MTDFPNPSAFQVPEVGLEPTPPEGDWILNPARLPIPPLRLILKHINLSGNVKKVKFVISSNSEIHWPYHRGTDVLPATAIHVWR